MNKEKNAARISENIDRTRELTKKDVLFDLGETLSDPDKPVEVRIGKKFAVAQQKEFNQGAKGRI